jgi:ubiquitin carboxyl-terminal hydrolase 47
VYELFAVLVHSGTQGGGHYFAYIKSFDDGKWYQFNDREVTPTTEDSIERAYGRKYGEASAYMLKYRRVVKDKQIYSADDIA